MSNIPRFFFGGGGGGNHDHATVECKCPTSHCFFGGGHHDQNSAIGHYFSASFGYLKCTFYFELFKCEHATLLFTLHYLYYKTV